MPDRPLHPPAVQAGPRPPQPRGQAPGLGGLARGPLPKADPGLVSQWRQFLAKPEVRTALLRFGVVMLQPNQPGETTLSKAGVALGSAGEAVEKF